MNLYQKLVELQKSADIFVKDSKSYAYKYVSGSQVLSTIKETKDKLGLLLIPSVTETTTEKIDKNYLVKGTMTYTWVNAENPEEVLTTNWALFGAQDDISKAFGSALTYSERYFLLKFLGIPTDDEDPDAKESKPKEKTYQAERTYDKPQEKTSDKPPSKFGKLKDIAEKEGKRMDEAIALSEKMFGTNMINSLTETQFLEVVSALRTKKELPLGKPIQIDYNLPF